MGCAPSPDKTVRRCVCHLEFYCSKECQRKAYPAHADLHRAAMSTERIPGLPRDTKEMRALRHLCMEYEDQVCTAFYQASRDQGKVKDISPHIARTINVCTNHISRLMFEMTYRIFEASPDLKPTELHNFLCTRHKDPKCVTRIALIATNPEPGEVPMRAGARRTYRLSLIVAATVEVFRESLKKAGIDTKISPAERLNDAGFVLSDKEEDNVDPSFVPTPPAAKPTTPPATPGSPLPEPDTAKPTTPPATPGSLLPEPDTAAVAPSALPATAPGTTSPEPKAE
jgi:hypothetical protein